MMQTIEPLDLTSRVAYYLQMKEGLQKRIESGELKPGEKLPSEADLCTELKVSRTVVRQALMELEHEGLVYKRKGKGAFIAEPKFTMRLATLRSGFSRDHFNQDKKIRTVVLEQKVIASDPKVANYLQISPGDKVIQISRLRYVNEVPMLLSTTCLPYQCAAPLEHADLSQSLYGALKNLCGIELAYNDQFIEAVSANEKESEIFGLNPGTPMLRISIVSYTAEGLPVERSNVIHRGDRSRLEARLALVKDINAARVAPEGMEENIYYTTD